MDPRYLSGRKAKSHTAGNSTDLRKSTNDVVWSCGEFHEVETRDAARTILNDDEIESLRKIVNFFAALDGQGRTRRILTTSKWRATYISGKIGRVF